MTKPKATRRIIVTVTDFKPTAADLHRHCEWITPEGRCPREASYTVTTSDKYGTGQLMVCHDHQGDAATTAELP
jgi:hypothetical protein